LPLLDADRLRGRRDSARPLVEVQQRGHLAGTKSSKDKTQTHARKSNTKRY
jgi:hypothetical protein